MRNESKKKGVNKKKAESKQIEPEMVVTKVCRICHLGNSRGTSPVFSEVGKRMSLAEKSPSSRIFYYQQPIQESGWIERIPLFLQRFLPHRDQLQDDTSEFIAPCACRGSMRHVHRSCLNTWRLSSPRRDSFSQCEQCFTPYRFACGPLARLLVHRMTISVATIIVYLGLMASAFTIIQSALELPIGVVSVRGHAAQYIHVPYTQVHLCDNVTGAACTTPTATTTTSREETPTLTKATNSSFWWQPPTAVRHYGYHSQKILNSEGEAAALIRLPSLLDGAARWLTANQTALHYTGFLLIIMDYFFVSPGSPLPLLLFIMLLLWRSLSKDQVWLYLVVWLSGIISAVRFGILAHETITYHIRRYVQLNYSIIQSCSEEEEDDVE